MKRMVWVPGRLRASSTAWASFAVSGLNPTHTARRLSHLPPLSSGVGIICSKLMKGKSRMKSGRSPHF